MKKYIALLFMSVVACAYASDAGELPEQVKTIIRGWVCRNKPLVDALLAHGIKLIDYGSKHQENCVLLQQKWVRNYGAYNYIFEIAELPGYVLKISSLPCRLANIVVANDYQPSYFLNESDEERRKLYAEFKMVPTFQTASYWNTYQLYCDLAKKSVLSHVRLPHTFVFKLVDDEPMHDQNCIVVQEKIVLVGEKIESRLLRGLSDEQLKELVTVIGTCGLWNLKSNIKFDLDGNIVIVSLEQPNVSNPLKGFNQKDPEQFMKNVQGGIGELSELFDGDEHRQQVIQQCADPMIEKLYDRMIELLNAEDGK